MRITLMDKTLDIEDYEVTIKSDRDGNIVTAIKTEGVLNIELGAGDTKRLHDTFISAFKIIKVEDKKCACAKKLQ